MAARQVARASPLRRTFLASTRINASRPFSVQSCRLIKEDANRSPEEVEKLKQEQLKKQKDGEGHWHEELASAGEAAVKNDDHTIEDHDSHMEDLQKETAEKHEKDHAHGKAKH